MYGLLLEQATHITAYANPGAVSHRAAFSPATQLRRVFLRCTGAARAGALSADFLSQLNPSFVDRIVLGLRGVECGQGLSECCCVDGNGWIFHAGTGVAEMLVGGRDAGFDGVEFALLQVGQLLLLG